MKIDNIQDINILRQIINLYEQALLFYSNQENYKNVNIENDKGHQSRYALDTSKKLISEYKNSELEYEQHTEFFDNENLTEGDILKRINKLREKYG